MKIIDPFTRTPGVAGRAFINMHYADEIIENFESDLSAKYVYKIVGLRGSGKSVEYRKIINTFARKKGWLTYTLSAAGDPVATLIAQLSREPFINAQKYSITVSAGGAVQAGALIMNGSAQGSVTKTTEDNPFYYAPETVLSDMIQQANDCGYKVLVGIDDIAKTTEMVKFLSIWGMMLLDDRKAIYFVCTGLSKNIEDFTDEPNLTFFKRSDPIEIRSLDKYEIAAMYQQLLEVDEAESVRLARFTEGYAYAYQVLGSIYFSQKATGRPENLIAEFDKIMFRDSYDLIWNSLTKAEQEMVRAIVSSESGKASEIKAKLRHPSGYDSLRNRLENKHLINTADWGYVRIDLPRFKNYVLLWHGDPEELSAD